MSDRLLLASDGGAASAAALRWAIDGLGLASAGVEALTVRAGADDGVEPLVDPHVTLLVVAMAPRDHRSARLTELAMTRAHLPVVVVPAGWIDREGPVLVGIGAEDDLTSTLAFAAATAAARQTELRLVHSWQTTGTGEVPPAWDFGTDSIPERQQRALAHLARMAQQSHPELIVTAEAVQGPVVPQLAAAARTASVLVVGRSHRNAVVQAMFGSTARGLLAELPCPVAVIP